MIALYIAVGGAAGAVARYALGGWILDRMIGGGLITLERARVILYRPADAPEDERARHRMEGLEAEES